MGRATEHLQQLSKSLTFDGQKATTRFFNLREEPLTGVRKHSDNALQTCRYNVLTFLPVNLFEQFVFTPINTYFLIMSILQMVPELSVTGGLPTTAMPLAFVVLVAMLKDGVEDYKRYVSDKSENNRLARRNGKGLDEVRWKDLLVGDTLLLKNQDLIPVDCIICASSDSSGLAYVETANLDGETNLKVRNTPVKATSLFKSNLQPPLDDADRRGEEEVLRWSQLYGSMETELPNGSLGTFTGTLTVSSLMSKPPSRSASWGAPSSQRRSEWYAGGAGKKAPLAAIPFDASNVLLRGCKLRNTAWVVGKVVFTGKETKIQMNQTQKARRKRTQIELCITRILICMLCIQLFLCTGSTFVNTLWYDRQGSNLPYLYLGDIQIGVYFLYRTGTMMLLFVNFIPISLVVTMSMVKLLQVLFLGADNNLEWNGNRCVPKTSDLNEELGQVEYVFSDKTGTLTQNLMEFRKCAVHGVLYGLGLTEIRRQVMKREGKVPPVEPVPPVGSKQTPMVNFIDPRLENALHHGDQKTRSALLEFFLHLSINHTALPEVFNGSSVYSASSPDEGALVYGAKHFGFECVDRPHQQLLRIDLPSDFGGRLEVELLATIEFTSDRKRSSVLARFQHPTAHNKVCYLYTKGADTVMRPLMKVRASELEKAQGFLDEFAVDGLRTLMMGGRVIDEEECEWWLEEWNRCSEVLENRAQKMAECAELIERDLALHGITGVEDRLQGEVSETIEILQRAGMKVWMLTGDKVETAINIGIATGLVPPACEDERRPVFSWDEFTAQAERTNSTPEHIAREYFKKCQQYAELNGDDCFDAVVVDGASLSLLLRNPDGFIALTKGATSVLCCRVSPDQKGQVVRLFKRKCKKTTLAIGDGANDCNMIRSAHIGVGIRGEEGLQAFNVSDFGIGQFKFLSDLCIVNGRQYYRRQSFLVVYFFYKNAFVVIPQLLLGCSSIMCGGTRLYPDLMFQLYNVLYTAFPILAFCMFDKDLTTRAACIQYAHLYKLGPAHYYLNYKRVSLWIAKAFWHSALLFFLLFAAVYDTVLREDGLLPDVTYTGIIAFNAVVAVVTARVVLESSYCTWVMGVFLLITLTTVMTLPIFFNFILFLGFETFGAFSFLISSAQTYLIVLVVTSVLLLGDIYWKVLEYNYYPTPVQIVQRKIDESATGLRKVVVSPSDGEPLVEASRELEVPKRPTRLSETRTTTAGPSSSTIRLESASDFAESRVVAEPSPLSTTDKLPAMTGHQRMRNPPSTSSLSCRDAAMDTECEFPENIS